MQIIILGNCAPGSYDDDTDCSLCAYGYYQDKWTQKNCTWCGNNLNTSRQGANSSDECQGKIYHWCVTMATITVNTILGVGSIWTPPD